MENGELRYRAERDDLIRRRAPHIVAARTELAQG